MDSIILLIYCVLEALEDLHDIQRVKEDKWKIIDIFLN